jgi:hypothetical protein
MVVESPEGGRIMRVRREAEIVQMAFKQGKAHVKGTKYEPETKHTGDSLISSNTYLVSKMTYDAC